MKIRKAILTGGGRATRLHPITTTINKHLLPLANKPMIFYAIEKVVAAGVQEIFINVNPGETDLQQYIGDGGHWGVRVTFFEQRGGPQGIAHVVKEAERFIGDDPFMFYLSDNIILSDIDELVREFKEQEYDCMIALAKVPDPERFGVPVFDALGKLVDVIEKPEQPPSEFAVTGIYLYGPKVFFDAFNNIQKSQRGEYEISSIHSHFLKQGFRVGHKEVTGWWKDTGKPEDLLHANKLLLDQLSDEGFPNHGTVDAGARVSGKVRTGFGTKIGNEATIVGPVMIGENCLLQHCSVGPYVSIGAGTEIVGVSVKNSIILGNSTLSGDMTIADSLIGKKVRIVSSGHGRTYKLVVGDRTVLETD